MATLSLAMIVKNEGDTIERVLGCARAFADEMIVVDTGSTDDTVSKAKAMGAIVHHFEWIDDFAAARNFAFSQCSKDWIIWLDGDDHITPENQQKIAELKTTVLNEDFEAVYCRYNVPPYMIWRERIIPRRLFGTKLKWKDPIHECIDGIDHSKINYCDAITIEHDTPEARLEGKKDRNLNLLRKHFANDALDERLMYHYILECIHHKLKEETEAAFHKFLPNVKYAPYEYDARIKMYELYIQTGDLQLAAEHMALALAQDPARAEAYYKLGHYTANHKNNPEGAIPLLNTARMIQIPSYGMPEVVAYSYGPWEMLSRVYFRLEDYPMAKRMAAEALRHNPPAKAWLESLVEYGISPRPPMELPDEWQAWVEENLARSVHRHIIIHTLEDNNFQPDQIITGLRSADAKKPAANTEKPPQRFHSRFITATMEN